MEKIPNVFFLTLHFSVVNSEKEYAIFKEWLQNLFYSHLLTEETQNLEFGPYVVICNYSSMN